MFVRLSPTAIPPENPAAAAAPQIAQTATGMTPPSVFSNSSGVKVGKVASSVVMLDLLK